MLIAVGVLMLAGVPAFANHPPTTDNGADVPWTNEMNQASYWDAYFGGTCQKYENHPGSIPDQYEAAVVKSGSEFVRVYLDPPAQVLGPPNPNAQHPNRRHAPPFSWVMKCNIEVTTTTTPETTTTTPETTTTETPGTTVPDDTTTTEPETSTTQPDDTTTALQATSFVASVACLPDGSFEISVEFGDGMAEAHVSLLDPMFPIDEPDHTADILTPGDATTRGKLPTFAQFQVTGFPADGYQIVGPNPVVLDVEPCPQSSTTSLSVVGTSAPTEPLPTLPFTGPGGSLGLALLGLSLLGLGAVAVRSGREES